MDLQNLTEDEDVPDHQSLTQWCSATLASQKIKKAEVCIRVVSLDESEALNKQYRKKAKPTNVLSFPSDLPEELNLPFQGDLVICAPIVSKEASEQQKNLRAHWAHMVVHGTLHLLGFDHAREPDAETMELLEITILESLGFANPYSQ